MARLYREPEKMKSPTGTSAKTQLGLEKIAKLVPSEIIAGYLTILGFISALDPNIQEIVSAGIIALCTCLTPIYLKMMSDKDSAIRNHLIMSTIAFLVWAYAISGNNFPYLQFESSIASILLVVFTLISGVVPLNK
ncbi:hypothetical protein [Ekhidna sp.]|uniref:hypothetical protein n=1 Tax=Ekhidna sp. TaxID=2608089 RepID=UPI003BAC40C1